MAPAKPYVNVLVAFLTPLLIFSQLLLTFCKVEVHELKPKSWHGWLLLFQTVSCLIVAVLLVCCLWRRSTGKCLKVQWSVSFVPLQPLRLSLPVNWWKRIQPDDYTLLSNLLAAVAVPLVFPLVELMLTLLFLLHS